MRPFDIELAKSGTAIVITTDDGRRHELSADSLWRQCPSAVGRVRRATGMTTPPAGLTIACVREIGVYGVNVAFSDGHDRGIYPWSYLAELADRPTLEDFLIE